MYGHCSPTLMFASPTGSMIAMGTDGMSAGDVSSVMNGGSTGSSSFRSIDDIDVEGKRVFVRADLNVPMDDGEIKDATRIRAALPTIKYILDRGGSVVLASHLGRPRGEPDPALSLEPVGRYLGFLLEDTPIIVADDCVGPQVEAVSEMLNPGNVLLLENLRFHAGEKENDVGFASKLASLADVYVNDAFGTSHRSHASTVGMVKFFEERAAGLLLKRELDVITGVLKAPEQPFISILGGAKVSDKLGVVKSLLPISDAIIIGGAMAYTFLKARGNDVGASLVENDMIDAALEIIVEAERDYRHIHLPNDHIAAANADEAAPTVVDAESIPAGLMGLDIGPKSRAYFANTIVGNLSQAAAKTIFWNGPMGLFEDERYADGTTGIAEAVASSHAFSVIGGGDSVAAVKHGGFAEHISHISTGGGAMLNLVAGKALPGVEALKR